MALRNIRARLTENLKDPATRMKVLALVGGKAIGLALILGAMYMWLGSPTHAQAVPSFDVPDRPAALAALQAAGCTLIPIGPHAPGEHYVQDPFGVVFDVIQR